MRIECVSWKYCSASTFSIGDSSAKIKRCKIAPEEYPYLHRDNPGLNLRRKFPGNGDVYYAQDIKIHPAPIKKVSD